MTAKGSGEILTHVQYTAYRIHTTHSHTTYMHYVIG